MCPTKCIMKKSLSVLVLLLAFVSYSQTILSSSELELKKPWDDQQLISTKDLKGNYFFVFAADKEKVIAQKYNAAFFLRDSLEIKRPEKKYSFMAGSSLDANSNPTVYWVSEDFTKILAVRYDFDSHASESKVFVFPLENETLLNSFSENGIFHILTLADDDAKLILYTFKGGNPEQHILDFTSFTFENIQGKNIKLNDLLEVWPVEKMEPMAQNTLLQAAAKTKLYVTPAKFIFTFDHNSKYTQIFEVSIDNYAITELKQEQPGLQKAGTANSFYSNGNLYQLKLNEEELALSSLKLHSDNLPIIHRVSETEEITIKNSPLLVQTANEDPFPLKNTRKFLRRIAGSDVGISVYAAPGGVLLTVGGVRNYRSTGNIILGASLGLSLIASGTPVDHLDGWVGSGSRQSVFFEGLFNEKFEHLDKEQKPLATDFISQFLNENEEVGLYTLTPYKLQYVLSYYLPKTKQIILRKFRDGRPF